MNYKLSLTLIKVARYIVLLLLAGLIPFLKENPLGTITIYGLLIALYDYLRHKWGLKFLV